MCGCCRSSPLCRLRLYTHHILAAAAYGRSRIRNIGDRIPEEGKGLDDDGEKDQTDHTDDESHDEGKHDREKIDRGSNDTLLLEHRLDLEERIECQSKYKCV